MKSGAFAVAIVASMALTMSPVLAPPAAAQTPSMSSASTVVPLVLWAATGAVIGAVVWPVIVGGAAAAGPAGIVSVSSFFNTGAAAGTFLGGAGYLLTR
jgi:prolipoprotein diacylglyceryltransferase